jgi:hypothetical protein
MSSGLQNKMYNLEVTPPAGVWGKIAAGLDEAELHLKFPSRLHTISVNPPAHIWQKIAATLDEPVFINDYSTKLSGIEMDPPSAAWNKIKASLDAENAAAIPERKRLLPFLKYAAAAVIIGFLAWGGLRLFNNKSADAIEAKQDIKQPGNTETTLPTETVNLADENSDMPVVATSADEARNDAALEASKKTYAKLDVSISTSKIKKAANFFFASEDNDYIPAGTTRGLTIEPEVTPVIDNSKRYIMLMTPEGYIIRMSKKLSELVCCVSGEEQGKDCVDQLKIWREKIASPSTSHSSGNFMNILNMVNSIQEN